MLFLKGLKLSIKEKVYHLNHSSVSAAMRTTMKLEQEMIDASWFLDKKREGDRKKSDNLGKKYKSDLGFSSGNSSRGQFSGLSNENREPWERACFGCGQPKNFKRDYPNPNREQQSCQSPNTQIQTQGLSRTNGTGQSYSFNWGRGQNQNGNVGEEIPILRVVVEHRVVCTPLLKWSNPRLK